MKTLKKQVLLITLLSLSLFNCNKDDDFQDLEPSTQELLIGKWNYETTSSGQASICEAKSFIHFLDSESLITQSVYDFEGTMIVGAELIDDCQFLPENNGSYTLSQTDNITYTVPGFGLGGTIEVNFQIVSISETTLVISNETNSYILTKTL